ncbi:MAG TPA: hypothetical protein VKQ05_00750 [Gemmatimonadales bacterium]|nr:hypothetical protein [Gemmatimonadales bacterium]
MSGRYVGMSGDTLFLHTNATLQPVRTFAIDSLWTRHRPIGREGIHGMVIGVGVGSAILLVEALPHIFDCWRFDVFAGSSTQCHSRVRLHASTVALTTGIGTVLGALAGLISPEWKRRIP